MAVTNSHIKTTKKCLTSAEYQALSVIKQKKQKYNNTEVTIEGTKFQSRKEGKEFENLQWRKQTGEIAYFKTQVKFPLLETARGKKRTYKKRSYIADFVVYDDTDRIIEIIDTKAPPTRTALYTLKIHLLYIKYGIEVTEK